MRDDDRSSVVNPACQDFCGRVHHAERRSPDVRWDERAYADGIDDRRSLPRRYVVVGADERFVVPVDGARAPGDRRGRIERDQRRSRDNRKPFTVAGSIQDGTEWTLGTTNGLQIGTSTSQKVGFFGKTPTTQQTMGSATAGSSYGTNEQTMLQAVYNAARALGLGS